MPWLPPSESESWDLDSTDPPPLRTPCARHARVDSWGNSGNKSRHDGNSARSVPSDWQCRSQPQTASALSLAFDFRMHWLERGGM
eukprot:3882086-Rhodomonas_salina.1